MSEKRWYSRVVHKHDIEANWNRALEFIPMQGEIVVYDADETYNYERFKIGDGKNAISALPFADVALQDYVDEEITTLYESVARIIAQMQINIDSLDHPVDSVNGKTGAVVLTASDVQADPSGSADAALSDAKTYTDAEIIEWIGDTKVSVQIQNAISSHKHVIADISNIVVSATQPSSPTTGMLWFDIS